MSSDKPVGVYASNASIFGEENAVCNWVDVETQKKQILQRAIASPKAPECIVYPRSGAQLSEAIALANRHKWRVLPCGNGSKLHWGGLTQAVEVVVSTQHLNRLIDHAVGDMTVTVEAGMKFAHLQGILAKVNQFLGLDPANPDEATMGGIVATADTGSLRQGYGSVRDQLLGMTFVRADGAIAHAGGRVVKNVAGYDLMKLFTGSYGTLGIITQVTFRLYPIQPASRTVFLCGSVEAVSDAATTIRNSALTPTQADLLSQSLVSRMELGKGMGLIVRFQSIEASVTEQSNRVKQVGEKLGLQTAIYSAHTESDLWYGLRQQIYSHSTESAISCKIGVLPMAAVEVLHNEKTGLIHIASGLGMLQLQDEKQVLEMRNLCESKGGFLSILQAPTAAKHKLDVWGYRGNGLQLMQGIKKKFDTGNILSPGRFVGGI